MFKLNFQNSFKALVDNAVKVDFVVDFVVQFDVEVYVDVLQILHVKWLDGENVGSAKLAVQENLTQVFRIKIIGYFFV